MVAAGCIYTFVHLFVTVIIKEREDNVRRWWGIATQEWLEKEQERNDVIIF